VQFTVFFFCAQYARLSLTFELATS